MGLEEPTTLHRTLLEAQREVIVALRRFETVHAMRREKLREFVKLRRIVNQASHMLIQLKNEFPHVEARLAHMREKDEPAVKKEPVKPVMSISDDAELHRLDRELSEIESKLQQL